MLPVIFIVCFTVFVRIAGIHYGLPLTTLVADESGLIFAALKMIQLKTLLPGLHSAAFEHILYYPPYIAYLYIGPFLMFAGIKYIILGLSAGEFQNYIAANLSPFFIIARSINIIFAAVSVWLVYKISLNLFKNKKAALVSCFFLATSMLHISLSMVARHWLPASFLFLLGFYFLTRGDWSFKKRYLFTVLTAGIGMGITPITGLIGVLMILWYLFYERHGIGELFKEKFFYPLFFIFVLLAVVPVILYPSSYNFFKESTGVARSLFEFIASPFFFLKPAFITEPVLMLFALLGIGSAFLFKRNLFPVAFIFTFVYSAFFYLAYWYLHRFILPLLCFLMIFAGYGFAQFWERFRGVGFRIVAVTLLLIPLVISLQFSYLAYKGDSRVLAKEWAEKNLPAGVKVIVAGDVRLLTAPDAVEEKRILDPDSINKFDGLDSYSDEVRRGAPVFYALNLDYVDAESFFYENTDAYIVEHNYEYMIIRTNDGRFLQTDGLKGRVQALKSFGSPDDLYRHYYNEFISNPAGLFKISELGPRITIYKIR